MDAHRLRKGLVAGGGLCGQRSVQREDLKMIVVTGARRSARTGVGHRGALIVRAVGRARRLRLRHHAHGQTRKLRRNVAHGSVQGRGAVQGQRTVLHVDRVVLGSSRSAALRQPRESVGPVLCVFEGNELPGSKRGRHDNHLHVRWNKLQRCTGAWISGSGSGEWSGGRFSSRQFHVAHGN